MAHRSLSPIQIIQSELVLMAARVEAIVDRFEGGSTLHMHGWRAGAVNGVLGGVRTTLRRAAQALEVIDKIEDDGLLVDIGTSFEELYKVIPEWVLDKRKKRHVRAR